MRSTVHQLIMRLAPIWWRWLPLWMMLIFLATTPYTAMQRELWTDEAFTASYMQHPTIGMVLEDIRKNEESPPLYFLLMWLWTRVVGTSEEAIRLPSVLAGMSSVGLLIFLTERWFSQKAALIAGIVVSLSPLIARYAIEARTYSLLVFVSLVCIAAFEYLYHHPDKRIAQILYAITAAILFLTSYFGIALLAAHHLIWLARLFQERSHWKKRLLSWLMIQLAIGVILIPWLPTLLYQIHVAPAVTHPHLINSNQLLWLAFHMVAYTQFPITIVPILLFVLLWFFILYGLVHSFSNQKQRGILLRFFIVPALMMILVLFLLKVSVPRYALVLLPGLIIGAAVGWHTFYQRFHAMGKIVGGVLFLLLLFHHFSFLQIPSPNEKPWQAFSEKVAQQVDPSHDVVVIHPPFELRTFIYYYRGPSVPILGASHYDEFYHTQGYSLMHTWTPQQIVEKTRHYRHVWVLFKPFRFPHAPFSLPYKLLGHWKSGGIELFKYNVSKPGPDLPKTIPE